LLTQAITALEASDYDVASLQTTLNQLLVTTGQKPGVLFSLIRLAVSWAPFSPALPDTLAVLGEDTTLRRLRAALAAMPA
jgi:glutamyl-tRNA synthetase